MAGGKWPVASGDGLVAGGEGRVGSGKGPVAGGEGRVAGGKCSLTRGKGPVAGDELSSLAAFRAMIFLLMILHLPLATCHLPLISRLAA